MTKIGRNWKLPLSNLQANSLQTVCHTKKNIPAPSKDGNGFLWLSSKYSTLIEGISGVSPSVKGWNEVEFHCISIKNWVRKLNPWGENKKEGEFIIIKSNLWIFRYYITWGLLKMLEICRYNAKYSKILDSILRQKEISKIAKKM